MKLLAYIGSWIGLVGFVWVLFERAEKAAKPEAKKKVSAWLNDLSFGDAVTGWPDRFATIFDAVFGERHFTWKCFFRSSLASICAVTILALVVSAIFPIWDDDESVADQIITILLAISIFNLLPDYLSLLETRMVIKWMKSKQHFPALVGLLLIDVLLTLTIILSGIMMLKVILILTEHSDDTLVEKLRQGVFVVFRGLLASNKFAAIFVYSTFLTSAWVWVFALSVSAIAILNKFQALWSWLSGGFLNIDERPFLSIGWVASMLLTIFFVLSMPIFLYLTKS